MGVGADAIDPRLELAIACVVVTCVNFGRWLTSLDSKPEASDTAREEVLGTSSPAEIAR